MFLIKEPNGEHALVESLDGHEDAEVIQEGVEPCEFAKVDEGFLCEDLEREMAAARRQEAVELDREEILDRLEMLEAAVKRQAELIAQLQSANGA